MRVRSTISVSRFCRGASLAMVSSVTSVPVNSKRFRPAKRSNFRISFSSNILLLSVMLVTASAGRVQITSTGFSRPMKSVAIKQMPLPFARRTVPLASANFFVGTCFSAVVGASFCNSYGADFPPGRKVQDIETFLRWRREFSPGGFER
jgi:hypothetical protein